MVATNWTTFGSSWGQILLQSSPNIWCLFGLFLMAPMEFQGIISIRGSMVPIEPTVDFYMEHLIIVNCIGKTKIKKKMPEWSIKKYYLISVTPGSFKLIFETQNVMGLNMEQVGNQSVIGKHGIVVRNTYSNQSGFHHQGFIIPCST